MSARVSASPESIQASFDATLDTDDSVLDLARLIGRVTLIVVIMVVLAGVGYTGLSALLPGGLPAVAPF